MFQRIFHIIATVLLASCAACTIPLAGQADSLQQQLSSMYQGKKVVLAVPACGHKLKFDAGGNPQGKPEPGSWTICSGVLVEDVHVDAGQINFSGKRIYYYYDKGEHQFRDVAENLVRQSKEYKELLKKQQVLIEIPLPADADQAKAQELINKVFKLEPQDAVPIDRNSSLWKDFVPGTTDTVKPEPDSVMKDAGKPHAHVIAPKPLHTPDPSYTEEARDARLQGTDTLEATIDPDGNVADIKLVRPVGGGLDEKAAGAVSKWKFRPGMKDNKPVAVRLNIEVDFRLY
jgi:TonB family protein